MLFDWSGSQYFGRVIAPGKKEHGEVTIASAGFVPSYIPSLILSCPRALEANTGDARAPQSLARHLRTGAPCRKSTPPRASRGGVLLRPAHDPLVARKRQQLTFSPLANAASPRQARSDCGDPGMVDALSRALKKDQPL